VNIEQCLIDGGVHYVDSSHHHVRRGWVGADCPDCSPGQQKFRLGFELATGRCNCWFCGLKSGFDMLEHLTGFPRGKIASYWFDDHYEKPTSIEIEYKPKHVPRVIKPKGLEELGPAHRRYLESRGFDPDEIVRIWGVKGLANRSEIGWRIWIPIRNKSGLVVSWTSRAITDREKLRYLSAKESEEVEPHKKLLYGEHLVMGSSVIVFEGPIDAWSVGPGSVATCGTGFEESQVARLARYARRVICFDSSPDAQTRADDLCRRLEMFDGETIRVELETGDDAAESDQAERDELRRLFL